MDIITFRTFVEDRDKAIENLDVKALLKCCKEYGCCLGIEKATPKVQMATLCKSALAITTISKQTKEKAGKWLKDNGFSMRVR